MKLDSDRALLLIEAVREQFYVCSPEDTVLQKLVWYRMSARESQKQWRDIYRKKVRTNLIVADDLSGNSE